MANKKTKKRLRKSVRKLEKQVRQESRRHPTDLGFGQGFPDLPPPTWDDGGAGVREPRRPRPNLPAGALALDEPRPTYLDLVS